MKKIYIILITFSVCCMSCSKQQENEPITQLSEYKQNVIAQSIELSSIHSDFLSFVKDNGGYSKPIEADTMVLMYLSSNSSKTKGLSNISTDLLSIKQMCKCLDSETRVSNEEQFSDLFCLAGELLDGIDINDNSFIDIDKDSLLLVLLSPSRYSMLPDKEFTILASQTAVYIDSFIYWSTYMKSIYAENGISPTKARTFGQSVKRYALQDAQSGLEAGICCCILGALDAAAIFVGAGVGSWALCFKDIYTNNL